MLALLRSNPERRRLFLAHSVSRAGDAFNTVALVVLVFRLTGSGTGVAGAVAFEVLPVLLLGPVAGLAADRLPRRRLMVWADLLRAGVALALVFASGSLGVAHAVAFGLSAGAVVFNPAAGSLLPDVVGEDEVVTANSALWTVAVVAQIALAPLAGLVIARFGRDRLRPQRRHLRRRSASGAGPRLPALLDRDLCGHQLSSSGSPPGSVSPGAPLARARSTKAPG